MSFRWKWESSLKLIEELIITTMQRVVIIFRIDRRFRKYPPEFSCEWNKKVVGRKEEKSNEREREVKEKWIDEGVYSLGMLFPDIQIYMGRNRAKTVPPLMKFYFRPFISNSFVCIYRSSRIVI